MTKTKQRHGARPNGPTASPFNSPLNFHQLFGTTAKAQASGWQKMVQTNQECLEFLNLRLDASAWQGVLRAVLTEGTDFGRATLGQGKRVNVEYVSANPTGPLHLGHGRQAALGDAVASLLEWTGWEVHREYYYNDAGAQIDRLAQSVRARYQEHFGRPGQIPEGGYQGEYVREIAAALRPRNDKRKQELLVSNIF